MTDRPPEPHRDSAPPFNFVPYVYPPFDIRVIPEGHWSRPATFGDGVPTWDREETPPQPTPNPRNGRAAAPREYTTLAHEAPTEYCRSSKNEESQAPELNTWKQEEEDQDQVQIKEESESDTGGRKTASGRKINPTTKARSSRGRTTGAGTSKKMPSATASKRVKNKKIERPFLIGSEAWPLDETKTRKPETPPEHTKGWRVYVKVPEGQPPITTWLKKVQFKIFHTYTNPTRMVEEPPFQIEETGWGGFQVEVKLFFVAEVGSRPQDRSHFLQLEPYGTEEEQEKQRSEKLVRSELLDFVEFNEPTEGFFDMLTDEAQFRGGKGGKGKGKGKAAVMKREDGEEPTVELPRTSTTGNPYSKELEQELLDILRKAEETIDKQIETEAKKEAGLREELEEIRKPPAPV